MVAPVALALLLVASTAYAFWAYRQAGKPRPAANATNEIEVTALTRTGTTGRAAISPDGKYIIYSVAKEGARASGSGRRRPQARSRYCRPRRSSIRG
jgi:hypothetical protein